MRLEELIRKRLLGNQGLTKLLAKYCGAPAVFHGDAPDDNQKGWLDGRTFPRISFNYDTLADKERKNAGSLYVSIHCENIEAVGAVFPEDVVPLVVKLLKDVIFSPDDFGAFCCSWNRTDSYSIKETKSTNAAYSNNLVVGCDVTFDILEYPSQISTDPDPVIALNGYIAETIPEALVLHYHEIEDFVEATGRKPVVYVRNAGYAVDRQTNSVCWMKGALYIHLICPDSGIRMRMITALANEISLAGEVIMADGSPMLVSALEGNNGADYMTVGQLKLETMYGILRTRPLRIGLSAIEISGKRR